VYLLVNAADHLHFVDHINFILPLLVADDYLAHAADAINFSQNHRLALGSAEDNIHILTSDNIEWSYLARGIQSTYVINWRDWRAAA
jgi:hypothetical protein